MPVQLFGCDDVVTGAVVAINYARAARGHCYHVWMVELDRTALRQTVWVPVEYSVYGRQFDSLIVAQSVAAGCWDRPGMRAAVCVVAVIGTTPEVDHVCRYGGPRSAVVVDLIVSEFLCDHQTVATFPGLRQLAAEYESLYPMPEVVRDAAQESPRKAEEAEGEAATEAAERPGRAGRRPADDGRRPA